MLIERESLMEVLKSFFTLTGVRIAVFDIRYREIAAYPQEICSYCRYLRAAPENDTLCRESDEKAFAYVRQSRKQYTYRCHAGLYESLYPILVIMGYLMIGQFIKASEQEQIRKRNCFTKESTMSNKDVYALQSLKSDEVDAIAVIMAVCAEYLCFQKIVSAPPTSLAEKAEQYIDTHLHEPVSVDCLAQVCGISRTSLYLLFKNTYGKGITEYINDKKIRLAEIMLQEQLPTHVIIEKIHISDANYFSRLFRQHTGMSLREYRKQIKQGHRTAE